MYSDQYEIAFSNFLDCREYDDAQEYIFQVARAAVAAGWKAAGGKVPVEKETMKENVSPLFPKD